MAQYIFIQKSLLRSGALFASPNKVHEPESRTPPHSDIRNICQIHLERQNQALSVCCPQPCSSAGYMFTREHNAWITTHQLGCFLKNELYKMPCRIDSTENPRSFRTPPSNPLYVCAVDSKIVLLVRLLSPLSRQIHVPKSFPIKYPNTYYTILETFAGQARSTQIHHQSEPGTQHTLQPVNHTNVLWAGPKLIDVAFIIS